jgi:hypothetical protein
MAMKTTCRLSGVLLLTGLFTGCGPHLETHLTTWPNGEPRSEQSYYLRDYGWSRVWHGPFLMWNQEGEVVARGTWSHGKPCSGICFVLALGDAGSAGGIGSWGRYEDGKLIERLGPGTVWDRGPPKPGPPAGDARETRS